MPKRGPSTINDRFNRVQGQLGAVERMINENEDQEKIMIQLQAVISSLESIKRQLLIESLKEKMDEEFDRVVRLMK